MNPVTGYSSNVDFTADCLEQMQVSIDGPKEYDCYEVTIKVGPEEYKESSRNPYTAMAYALESLAKRLKNQRPETWK